MWRVWDDGALAVELPGDVVMLARWFDRVGVALVDLERLAGDDDPYCE